MRKIVVVIMVSVLFACSDSNDDMEVIVDQVEEITNPIVMGDFISRAHPTSGKALVNSNKTILSFTNFKTDNGPKLLVYLSTDANATEFVNLGDLKGIQGDFSYNIPSNTDLSKYKIVNIWCVDFSVSFGTAELK
jgi:hypothetical protein